MRKYTCEVTEMASISLEAALALPILLLIFLQLGMSMYAIAAERAIFTALYNVSKEGNLLLATEEHARSIYLNEAGKVVEAERSSEERNNESAFSALLKDSLLTRIGSYFFEERLNIWFNETKYEKLAVPLLRKAKFFMQRPQKSQLGRLHLYYEIPGIWQNLERRQSVLLNNWSGFRAATSEKDELEEESLPDDIWSWDNFSRGQAFAAKYGANLSRFHPVVAKAEVGQVTMIKSINLTANTYRYETALVSEVKQWLDNLTAFEGTAETGEVINKKLLVIVPEDSPLAALEILAKQAPNAAQSGIELQIVSDQYALAR